MHTSAPPARHASARRNKHTLCIGISLHRVHTPILTGYTDGSLWCTARASRSSCAARCTTRTTCRSSARASSCGKRDLAGFRALDVSDVFRKLPGRGRKLPTDPAGCWFGVRRMLQGTSVASNGRRKWDPPTTRASRAARRDRRGLFNIGSLGGPSPS